MVRRCAYSAVASPTGWGAVYNAGKVRGCFRCTAWHTYCARARLRPKSAGGCRLCGCASLRHAVVLFEQTPHMISCHAGQVCCELSRLALHIHEQGGMQVEKGSTAAVFGLGAVGLAVVEALVQV